jgi:hypothetical protein
MLYIVEELYSLVLILFLFSLAENGEKICLAYSQHV